MATSELSFSASITDAEKLSSVSRKSSVFWLSWIICWGSVIVEKVGCATLYISDLVTTPVAIGIHHIPKADSTDSIMAIATGYDWDKISFASTLFLCPIIDEMLSTVPQQWHPEIRLGLQEALVNAAKHGNNLDPLKRVVVRFCLVEGNYWWIISDEGAGFENPCGCQQEIIDRLPEQESENGRGMSLLHQIFDRVVWNRQGTELRLCKQLECREPILC